MSAGTIVRPLLGTIPPNGLDWKPYVYQGKGYDTLTPHLDEPESQFEDLPRVGRVLSPCGTEAAWRRHQRHGERPCYTCRAAHARAKADRMARKRRTS